MEIDYDGGECYLRLRNFHRVFASDSDCCASRKRRKGMELLEKLGFDDYKETPKKKKKKTTPKQELDVRKIDRDLGNEKETPSMLQKEKEDLETEAAQEKKQLNGMDGIVRELEGVGEDKAECKLTLDPAVKQFNYLQRRYSDEYKVRNACSYALSCSARVFQGWNPHHNSYHGLEIVSSWKNLLQGDYYVDTWDASNPEPMLKFLERWEKLLPASSLNAILDNIVLPKLRSAV